MSNGKILTEQRRGQIEAATEDKTKRLSSAIRDVLSIVDTLEVLRYNITLKETVKDEGETPTPSSLQDLFDTAEFSLLGAGTEIYSLVNDITNILIGSQGIPVISENNEKEETSPPDMPGSIPERIYNAYKVSSKAFEYIERLKYKLTGKENSLKKGAEVDEPTPSVEYILNILPIELVNMTIEAKDNITDIRTILGV